jgi:membrane protease YdiL (CAAX protease family)
MRFLVDPAQVILGPEGWFFLAIICVVLPLAALRQHGRLRAGTFRPTRTRIYTSAIVTHAAFLLLTWIVIRAAELDLFPIYQFTWFHAVVGAVALAIGLLPIFERFRLGDTLAHERTRLIAPRTPREFATFYFLSVTAGVAEEITYRGLLFTLLAVLLGGWWSAALAASLAFGIVHLFQGWKSSGVAALMGLREHIVVGLTGTLVVVMVVHALHDAIAGTAIGLKAARDEQFTGAEGAAETRPAAQSAAAENS